MPKVKKDNPEVENTVILDETGTTSAEPVSLKYTYKCPKCGNAAIETSNKMLGVFITCKSCGDTYRLDDIKNYHKL